MVAFNGNNETVTLDDLSVVAEMTGRYPKGLDLTRDVADLPIKNIELKGKEVRVIVLR